jgi:hypothetical protein
MRRLGRGSVAATTMIALLAVLTGVCPCAEPARSADAHDCCSTPPGFRAADNDCCSKPGDAPLVVSVSLVHSLSGDGPALAPAAPAAHVAPRPVCAPSPVPFPVLRI